jgi:hypothetical protein
MDRLQEMFNTVFRSKLGKVSLPGHKWKMAKVAMSLGDIQKQRKHLASFRKKNHAPKNAANDGVSARHVRLHRVYCRVYATIRRMNLWGPGPIRIGPRGDKRDAAPNLLEAPGVLAKDGGLDAATLKAYPEGMKRAQQYIRSFILEDNPVKPLRAVTKKKAGIPWVPVAKTWVPNEKVAIKRKALKWLMMSRKQSEIKKAVELLGGPQKVRLYEELAAIESYWASRARRLPNAWTVEIANAATDNTTTARFLIALLVRLRAA